MVKIPPEVLHQIFIKVHLIDRLECMRVCRSWYDVLDRQSLLYDLEISDSQYAQLQEMLKLQHYRRLHLEYLTLNVYSSAFFDKRTLCNMFPNLREIALLPHVYSGTQQRYMNSPFQLTNESSKLESIKDYGECELTRQLIISNACQHVKSLRLKASTFWHSTDFGFAQLKNMPFLEHLHLCPIQIKLTDLELIHNNLPAIKSLDLEVELIAGDFPRDIKPALLVTKLKIYLEYNEDLNTHIELYRYMSEKYPSITTLLHDDTAIEEEEPENLQVLFERGLFPFFQSIKLQMAEFRLQNYYDGMYLFKKFDEFNWKLEELEILSNVDDHHFFQEIAQSEQSRYIQKLSLIENVCVPISMLGNMETLTSLKLEYFNASNWTENTINLSELIEYAPPTLTSLTVSAINLIVNEFTSKPSPITYLDIEYMDLTPPLTKLLATNFPKLSVLKYSGGLAGTFAIALPDHNLKEFSVTAKYPRKLYKNLSIKTTCGGEVQYHALKQDQPNHEQSTSGSLVPVTKEEFVDLSTSNTLAFECSSVNKMLFSVKYY